MHMITTVNQKELWSNSNCLYLARNLSLRFTIKTLGILKAKLVLAKFNSIHYICIKKLHEKSVYNKIQ